MGKGQYAIEVLDIAFDVLEYLAASEESSSQPSEIAGQLGIHRSRVFRILKNLERRGYAIADPKNKGYRLGYKCLQIGHQMRGQLDLYRVAEPVLIELAETTGDAAVLMVRHGNSAIAIASYQGHHLLQASVLIGQPFPLHVGASSRVLLAYLPERERECVIQEMELIRRTYRTITDRDELRRCLEEIRAQGYVVDEESFEIGVYAIGAPVRDHTGRVVAGVTVTTPQSRYNVQRRQELIEMVVGAANSVSARLSRMTEKAL